MSVIARICGIKGAFFEVEAPPDAAAIRAIVAAQVGAGLCEPDLPIGRLALPGDPVDRAVLAIVTRGAPRALLFVNGASARIARVRDSLDFDVAWTADASGPPLFEAAIAVLRDGGPMPGKALLREARARLGRASADDGAILSRALLRAWADGLLALR